MKKAKMIVVILGIIFVLSGVFAFKVSLFSNRVLYTGAITQPNMGSACLDRTEGITIGQGTPNIRASTTALTTDCQPVFTFETANE